MSMTQSDVHMLTDCPIHLSMAPVPWLLAGRVGDPMRGGMSDPQLVTEIPSEETLKCQQRTSYNHSIEFTNGDASFN